VIDRWPVHAGFLDTMADSTRTALEQIPKDERDDAVILFSAHSLPLSVINRGDPYPQEIGASVEGVMQRLGSANRYLLSYQSEVGPVRWQGPSTESVIRRLGARGEKNVVVVPIAFTSDHIETLSELDIEYGHLAAEAGITRYVRAPAPNDHPLFLDALADVVLEHLAQGEPASRQYALHCPGCINPECRRLLNPVDASQTSRITRDAGNSTRLATRSAS
jgi:ferrochelatase